MIKIGENKVEGKWTTVIEPKGSSFFGEIRELWEYRQLIKMFIKRDFKTMYAQTILGPLWFLLHAFLSSFVMNVVFGKIAGISTDGIPGFLFYMSGNILWNDFSGCLSSVSNTFTNNVRLMGKVWFPRMCVPISNILSRQIRFFIEFALFLFMYLLYGRTVMGALLSWRLLLLPLLLILSMALSMGVGMILSSVTIKYRDLSVLVGFFMQIWMYATPIVYPLSQVPDGWRWIILLNPMTSIVETFRCVLFGGIIPTGALFGSMTITAVLLLIGMLAFHRAQRNFLDTV